MESDAEFVERIERRWMIAAPGEDIDRLFALARRGAHLCGTARSLGWPDDGGEGAFEFVVRLTREVAFEDSRRGAAVQWRPIEEAPKDGTPILLLIQFPDEPPHIITALWDGRVPKWPWRPVGGSSAYGEEYATHWMPLPPPPAGETNE